MTIRGSLSEIAGGWASYKALRKVDASHSICRLVVDSFPSELRPILPTDVLLVVKGSTGTGNITSAPWIATFDPSVTDSATQGFYLVYLFSVDLKRVYLSLAFGTTQFKDYFGDRGLKERLRSAARHLQNLLGASTDLELGSLNLAANKRDRLHRDYEHSNIAAIEYDLAELPPEQQFLADYRRMIALYSDLVRNPLRPEIQELLEAETTAPTVSTNPEVTDFKPRQSKAKRLAAGGSVGRRYSQCSKKVGDQGERVVFEYELREANRMGRAVDMVRWHASLGETPGWDITSVDAEGNQIFLEVKSSVGKTINQIFLTSNEWEAAIKHGEKYFLYLVTDAMKAKPRIEIVRNPSALFESGDVTLETAVFEMRLGSAH